MKIARLELTAFGSLKGITLDLASQAPCLHVVYGPNEAGKSTALRAITGLFYGIPETTPDVHSIKGPDLRVGALLCDARGRELYVMRRKGRKDTLRSATGEPLLGADASWLTAGVAEATFRSLFGLNFASLHAGAQELLGSAGDLGQSLFGAAIGGGRVHALIEALHDEADQLFRPRGQTPQLNAALKAFDDAKRRSREQAIQAAAFSEQQTAIDTAVLEETRLLAERVRLRMERNRLERARRVIPLLQKRNELMRELETLSGVARLPDSATEVRRNAQARLREALLAIERVQRELVRLEREQAAISVPAALVELASETADALRDRLGGHRRSVRELPARREALANARAEVSTVLSQLGCDAAPGDFLTWRIPKQHEARIREHLKLADGLQRDLRELRRAKNVRHDQLERQRRALAQLWAADPTVEEALPLLTRFTLPSDTIAEQFERGFAEFEQAERALHERASGLDAAVERNRRDLEALALAGELPSEGELHNVREARSAQWSLLREQLDARQSKPTRPLQALARAIALTEQSDELADRLRREAGRVAEHARLLAEAQSNGRLLDKLMDERAKLAQQRSELSARWQALFTRAGIAARPPREVRSLLIEQRATERACEELERELASIDRDLMERTQQKRSLEQGWHALLTSARLMLTDAASAAEVETILSLRAELFVRVDAEQALARELADLERELSAFDVEVHELCTRHLSEATSEQPTANRAEQLIGAHQAARDALSKQTQLGAELARWNAELEQAQAAQTLATRELEWLMQAAAVHDLASLEGAERASVRATELEAALAQVNDELFTAADGASPEAALDTLPMELDEIRARLAALDEAFEASEQAGRAAAQKLASLKSGLSHLRQSHGAGDAALEASIQLETVRTLSERYVRTRLAASLLKREVARYRERHRAPLLRSAGERFAQLTLGNFSALDVDYGARDEPVLSCVRNDGSHLLVDALSTGTRDQLYLALRLASIEHLAEKQELMPLVLDDILIHFDDERARAALRVLAEFAETTQVLFFTHHRRLCELASEALASDRVRMHRLPTAPGSVVTLYS